VESLLATARWPDAREPVLVVGHQDTLGLTAAYLLSGKVQAWTVRKGAVWWIRRRERPEGTEVLLHAAVSAEQV
jgi:phosphohistidine phosphatase